MSHIRFARLFFALAFAAGATALSASTITYAVGTCRPGLKSFSTISAALAYLPAAKVVAVCPGYYSEQVQITHPVILEGVSDGTSAQAFIASPAGGLVANATDDSGNAVAPQLWVNNASGPVNISNLTVDGTGNGIQFPTAVAGIFYQNSSGTVNQVATQNQSGSLVGIGIWAEGGPSNPLITIENSSVHDYDEFGIQAETKSATADLTAVIKGNDVTTPNVNGRGIVSFGKSAVTITSNLIVHPGLEGIVVQGSAGSVTANTVASPSDIGIDAEADEVSVTSNKIFGSSTGIALNSSVETIQSNTITNSSFGIDFGCHANPNVHSNVITNLPWTALLNVPSAVITNNMYFNVGTIRSGC